MWTSPQFPTDSNAFTEEILNRKLHFLYSGNNIEKHWNKCKRWCKVGWSRAFPVDPSMTEVPII